MKRKKLFIALAVIIALAVPLSVFAAASDAPAAKAIRGFFGIDISKLNDKQEADIADFTKKMTELQKEFINKMVANGALTKEQGDAAIKSIDNLKQFQKGKDVLPDKRMRKGNMGDPGKKGGFNGNSRNGPTT